ncbi:MAG TPA: nucleotide exchange factor GrpE, partial [Bacteroidales bacterium]|nr:nucleotide exchange factor GrpE [Bacteroidales bacterium]
MIRKNKKEHTETKEEGNTTAGQGPVENAQSAEEKAATTGPAPAEPAATQPRNQADALTELNDKYLRLYSDFDNYRKRTLREKLELSKNASEEIILRLLPVLDDFDRALKAFETASVADQALKEGLVLIHGKFFSILQQQGLQPMRATGETFDTDFHEAVTNIPAPAPEQKGKIMDVIEKGYLLNGKVIRYA